MPLTNWNFSRFLSLLDYWVVLFHCFNNLFFVSVSYSPLVECVYFYACFMLFSDNSIIEPKMSASFVPDHKAPMVLFLDRVYGIDNQDFLLHVLEVGFLPDMRAAASLDTVSQKCLLDYFNTQYPVSVDSANSWDLFPTGRFQHNRDGSRFEPLSVYCRAATHHQVCPTVCRQWPPSHNDRLHVAHDLQTVSRTSLYKGTERHHRGVPHGFVQVS